MREPMPMPVTGAGATHTSPQRGGPAPTPDRHPRPARRNLRGRQHGLVAAAFLLPALVVYVTFVIYPALQSVNISFFDWTGPGRPAQFIGMDNYRELLTDSAFFAAIRHNIVVIVVSVLFQLPLGMGMALIITSKIRARRFWRAVYFLPMLMSTVAIGILWSYIFNPSFGLVNGFLGAIGLESLQQGWLGQSSTALGAVMVTTIWQFAPFYMIIYSAAIVAVPLQLYEAARLDGAGPIRQLFSITLPMLKPVIVTTVLLSVIGSIKFFDLVYVMTGGGPNGSTELLATYMFRQGFLSFRFGYASAIASAMLVFSLIAMLVVLARSFTQRPRLGRAKR